MDCLAQIMSEKHSNPIEFLNELRQTTEPIGGGMEYCDNGEYVEYNVAVEAVKKAQQKLINEACKWLYLNDSYAIPTNVQVDRLREHLNNIK